MEVSGGTIQETGDFLTVNLDQQVLHIPRKTLVGRLVATDAQLLTLMRGGEQLTIPRAAVGTLEVSRRQGNWGYSVIGPVIGGLVGTAVANSGKDRCAFGSCLAGPVIGAPLGALMGGLAGREKWEEASAGKVRVALAPAPRGVSVPLAVRF
jgi:hypothetical protein